MVALSICRRSEQRQVAINKLSKALYKGLTDHLFNQSDGKIFPLNQSELMSQAVKGVINKCGEAL